MYAALHYTSDDSPASQSSKQICPACRLKPAFPFRYSILLDLARSSASDPKSTEPSLENATAAADLASQYHGLTSYMQVSNCNSQFNTPVLHAGHKILLVCALRD